MATLEQITDRFRTAVGSDSGLDATLKFDLKGDGFIWVGTDTVTNDDAPADLTITLTKDDLEALGAGTLDPTSAVMSGRLKLSDMGKALQIQGKMQALFAKAR